MAKAALLVSSPCWERNCFFVRARWWRSPVKWADSSLVRAIWRAMCWRRRELSMVGKCNKSPLLLIRQLSAGRIDILPPAAAEAGIHLILFEVLHECRDGIFFGFGEEGLVDGIVFDDVDEVGGNLAVDLYELVGVLAAVVEVFEEDVFEGNFVAGLLVEMVERLDQGLDIVALVDRHDLIALFIVGRMQGEGQLEFDLVVAQLFDHFRDTGGGDGDAAGGAVQTVLREKKLGSPPYDL